MKSYLWNGEDKGEKEGDYWWGVWWGFATDPISTIFVIPLVIPLLGSTAGGMTFGLERKRTRISVSFPHQNEWHFFSYSSFAICAQDAASAWQAKAARGGGEWQSQSGLQNIRILPPSEDFCFALPTEEVTVTICQVKSAMRQQRMMIASIGAQERTFVRGPTRAPDPLRRVSETTRWIGRRQWGREETSPDYPVAQVRSKVLPYSVSHAREEVLAGVNLLQQSRQTSEYG